MRDLVNENCIACVIKNNNSIRLKLFCSFLIPMSTLPIPIIENHVQKIFYYFLIDFNFQNKFFGFYF